MSNRGTLILLVICGFFFTDSVGFGADLGVLDIIKLTKFVVEGIGKAWNIVDQRVDFSSIPIPILDKTEAKLFGKLDVITLKIDELAVNIEGAGKFRILFLFEKEDTYP